MLGKEHHQPQRVAQRQRTRQLGGLAQRARQIPALHRGLKPPSGTPLNRHEHMLPPEAARAVGFQLSRPPGGLNISHEVHLITDRDPVVSDRWNRRLGAARLLERAGSQLVKAETLALVEAKRAEIVVGRHHQQPPRTSRPSRRSDRFDQGATNTGALARWRLTHGTCLSLSDRRQGG